MTTSDADLRQFPLPCFDAYWAMWNTLEKGEVRGFLEQAVTEDFIFCDPVNWHSGRDGLEQNVFETRAQFPDATFVLTSGIDNHHNRYRYQWQMLQGDAVIIDGMDVTTVTETGLIERIDGFFGPIPNLDDPKPARPREVASLTRSAPRPSEVL